MHGSTFPPASLILLLIQGIWTYSPLPEEVTRLGHQIMWGLELALFLWDNRQAIRKLWTAKHSGTE